MNLLWIQILKGSDQALEGEIKMNILEEVHTYYHVTTKENYEKIKECMKLNSPFGNYVCKDIGSVIEFAKHKIGIGIQYDEVVILEFTSLTEVEESFNHNSNAFKGVRAFISLVDIDIQDIKVVDVDVDWKEFFRSSLRPV